MKTYPTYDATGIKWNPTKPSHWEQCRGKRFFYSQKVKNIGNEEKNILSLTLKGVIRNSADRPIGLSPSDYSTYQIFEKDDLVFKLIDLNNISTSRVGLVPERGIMSSAYIRLTARYECNIRYFFLQYYDLWLRNIYNGLGAGVRQTLSVDDLLALDVVIPPREEQDQIVRFLDWKVSEINRLINIKRKEIERLEELKQTAIAQTVRKSFVDNTHVSSGVEWIGEIPKHWSVKKIKTLFSLRDERNYKPLNEVNLISLYTKLGVVQNKDVNYASGNHARTADGYKIVYKNDIIVNIILCWMGAIGMSNYNGVTSPAYDIYIPHKGICSKYFHYLFRTKRFSGECYKAGKGIMAMRWRTYSPQFKNIEVPVPPEIEQIQIADYLDELCAKFDDSIQLINQEIERLREFKTRLISDVVTGKIDVRGIEIPEYEYTAEVADTDSEAEAEELDEGGEEE